MIRLGLTGSIGMGKSTTASMFREAGVPVHDADATVHALYEGKAVAPVGALFPDVVVDGKIDRARLGAAVLGNNEAMKKLEAVVHPLVHAAEAEFLAKAKEDGAKLVVLDIPLLFETKSQDRTDKVLVVTANADVQRARVLARDGMSEEKFEKILSRQMPDAEKRARADFIIDTGLGLDHARAEVARIIAELTA